MSFDHLVEGQWGDVAVGADYQRARARMVWFEENGQLHAYAKFRAGGRVLMAYASTDLAEMEKLVRKEILDELNRRTGGAVAGGPFRRRLKRMKNKLKRLAKKSGVVKVLKTVHRVVNKALDNPIVQAALASNPYGAAFLAARKATKMAFSAVKGSLKSKGKLRQLLNLAKGGNLKAKNILRFVKKQVKLNPGAFKNVSKLASMTRTSGDEMADLTAFVNGCTTEPNGGAVSGFYDIAGNYEIAGDVTDAELDAVSHFATSGAWEGIRWLAGRLSLHSMNAHADELSTRQALTSGRAAQAARFQFAAR